MCVQVGSLSKPYFSRENKRHQKVHFFSFYFYWDICYNIIHEAWNVWSEIMHRNKVISRKNYLIWDSILLLTLYVFEENLNISSTTKPNKTSSPFRCQYKNLSVDELKQRLSTLKHHNIRFWGNSPRMISVLHIISFL